MMTLPSKQDIAEQAAIEWLATLQSPSLSKEEEQSFFKWLEKSPENQAAYIKAEQLWERGDQLNQIPLAEEKRFFNFEWLFKPYPMAGTALCCCLAILFSAIIFWPSPTWTQAYTTALGEQKTVMLPDNSSILINTNSKLTVEYNKERRVVRLLSGEAFFSVTSAPEQAFDVITSRGTVRVLGTQFSVDTSSPKTLITVLEGKVALGNTTNTKEKFKANTTLTQNEQLSIEEARLGTPPKKVDALNKLAWRNKKLIYRGEKLIDVIRDINRYYESKLFLNKPTLGEKEVIAVLQLDNFSNTLNSLKSSLNLASSPNEDMTEITLSSASK